MRDERTKVSDLRAAVAAFVAERGWEGYHTPKNLAMSIAVEAGELMERFQWATPDEARISAEDPAEREAIEDELADVLAYCLSLANALDIDVARALERKLEKNRRKYPAAEFLGVWRRPRPP